MGWFEPSPELKPKGHIWPQMNADQGKIQNLNLNLSAVICVYLRQKEDFSPHWS
jgi:hypothetical protein